MIENNTSNTNNTIKNTMIKGTVVKNIGMGYVLIKDEQENKHIVQKMAVRRTSDGKTEFEIDEIPLKIYSMFKKRCLL